MTANTMGDLVEAVVDTGRELMALDTELHSDLEASMLQNESTQKILKEIILYQEISGNDWIELRSMIKVRLW